VIIPSSSIFLYHAKGSPYTIVRAANITLNKYISKKYGANNIRAYSLPRKYRYGGNIWIDDYRR